MPRKKKSFIDKKQSSTFHLVRRSQQDVLWEEGQVSSQNHISSHIHNSNSNNINSNNNNSHDGNEDGSDEEGSAVVIPNDYVLMPSPFNVNPKFQEPIALERVVEKPNPTTTTTKRRKENWSGSWLGRTEELLAEAGVTEYDYEKHLKPITGTGDFVAATGTDSATTVTSKLRSRVSNTNKPSPPPPLELVENIALSPAVMDEDVAAALFGDFDFDNNNNDDNNDNNKFEELLDDFVLTASAPEEEVPLPAAYQNESTEFDFQAHIQRLMERARQEPLQTLPSEFVNHAEWNRQKRDFAAHVTPLHEQKQKQLIDNHDNDNDDNDDESEEEFEEYDVEQDWGDPSSDPTNDKEMRPMEKEEERRLAEKLFEQTLAEYDDDELGDLEGYFESTRANHNNADNENNNNNSTDNDNDAKLLATILQSELTVEDEVPQWQPLSKPKKKGGSSYTALVGTSLQVHDSKAIHNSSNNKNKNNKSSNYFNDNGIPATIRVQKELDQAQQQLYSQAHLIDQAPPPEDVFIDGKSYFSETPRNPWDCESVLTTYSNLDNRPCTIDTNTHTSRRRLRSKAKHLIPLSEKTGLPLFNNDDDDNNNNNDADALTLATTGAFTRNGVNKGRSRNRHETPAEKKARKAQIKQERKICRLQKKVVGHVYAQEFQKRQADLVGDDVAGHSVFRY